MVGVGVAVRQVRRLAGEVQGAPGEIVRVSRQALAQIRPRQSEGVGGRIPG